MERKIASVLQSNWTRRGIATLTLAGGIGTAAYLINGSDAPPTGTRATPHPYFVNRRTPTTEVTKVPEIDESLYGQPIVPVSSDVYELVLESSRDAQRQILKQSLLSGLSFLPLLADYDYGNCSCRTGDFVIYPTESMEPEIVLGLTAPNLIANLGATIFNRNDEGKIDVKANNGVYVYGATYKVVDFFGELIYNSDVIVRGENGDVFRSGEWIVLTDDQANPQGYNTSGYSTMRYIPKIYYDHLLNERIAKRAREAGYGEYLRQLTSNDENFDIWDYKISPTPIIEPGHVIANELLVNPDSIALNTAGGIALLSQPDADFNYREDSLLPRKEL